MSNNPIEPKPASDGLADELETFRRRWAEDLKSQKEPVAPQSKAGEASSSHSRSQDQPADAGVPVNHVEATPQVHRRRQSQHARDGLQALQAPRESRAYHEDSFRSIDLDSKPLLVLGPGERSLTQAPLKTALEHYEVAVELEKEGKISDSVKLYRKAFKMDAAVQDLYKQKYFPRQPEQARKDGPFAIENASDEPITLPTSELIPTLSSIPIIPGTEINLASLKGKQSYRRPPPCPISTVPREILLHILLKLAQSDISSFVRCATVCKALCYIVYSDRQIWKAVCDTAYGNMVWGTGPLWVCDIKGRPLPRSLGPSKDASTTASLTSQFSSLAVLEEGNQEEGSGDDDSERLDLPTRPYDDVEVLKYTASYRAMFIDRPRVRYNGVYISTCTYYRTGHPVNTNLTLSNPIHLVTYYRYLRFFPSGFVLTLLTPAEPSEVVHALTLENYHHLVSNSTSPHFTVSSIILTGSLTNVKHMLPGRWRMVFDPRTYPSPSSTDEPGGRIEIEAVATLTDDRSMYSLKNDKPYYFSRVKAYEKVVLEATG
ncbi:hypothetical protein DRE_04058 [Drechslerella stenobrocha 248]|uniref:F-box domain-containing protein n=1 Tax=Drechslerella stenobrocha 248 TaxID=1043628 RepID=W7I3M7_9PEZI|nr:hypothetical protein DRE_04058 [Drechslerella stenobrocha 248]